MRAQISVVAAVVIAAAHGGATGQPRDAGMRADQPREYTGPRIVVRREGTIAPDRAAFRSERTIAVPANTVETAAPVWYTRSVQSADLRLARATADWVEAQADLLEHRRSSLGVHTSFLSIDPLIYSWPAGVGHGFTPVAIELPEDPDGDADAEIDNEPARTDEPAQPAAPPRPAAAEDDDEEYTGPRITVHRNGAARRDADRSVTRIHLPGGTYPVGSVAARGAVAVPENTLYAGPPTWYIRGLQAADVRIANATADWVEAKADRARRWNNRRH